MDETSPSVVWRVFDAKTATRLLTPYVEVLVGTAAIHPREIGAVLDRTAICWAEAEDRADGSRKQVLRVTSDYMDATYTREWTGEFADAEQIIRTAASEAAAALLEQRKRSRKPLVEDS
jgi:hypothetical protein